MELIKFTIQYIKQRITVFSFATLVLVGILLYYFNFLNTKEKPEILGIILSPLFTLSILSILEEYKAKWNSKYEAFKLLYANRGNLSSKYEVVAQLNIIDIVFIDDRKVRHCWKKLYDELCRYDFNAEINEEVQNWHKNVNIRVTELIQAMAISLGLNKNIEYFDIASTYYPKYLAEIDNLFINKTRAELIYYMDGSNFFKNTDMIGNKESPEAHV